MYRFGEMRSLQDLLAHVAVRHLRDGSAGLPGKSVSRYWRWTIETCDTGSIKGPDIDYMDVHRFMSRNTGSWSNPDLQKMWRAATTYNRGSPFHTAPMFTPMKNTHSKLSSRLRLRGFQYRPILPVGSLSAARPSVSPPSPFITIATSGNRGTDCHQHDLGRSSAHEIMAACTLR